MNIGTTSFGVTPAGEEITLFALDNSNGMRVEILNYGAILHALTVPDRKGQPADVLLGQADLEHYLANPGKLGAMVGRNANRLTGGQVRLGGKLIQMPKNDGDNNLHSGPNGLAGRAFKAEAATVGGQPALRLEYTMPHLSDGLPGDLHLTVTYTVTRDNALRLDYEAISNMETVINPTNHAYFNLAGHTGGTVLDQVLQIDAGFYTPTRPDKIPTGEILSVAGTPYDFTTPKPIGRDIAADYPHLRLFSGYDLNFVLAGRGFRRVATLVEEKSGRSMEVLTDLPGLQFFTANTLPPALPRKNGASYHPYQGACFETQHIPNAANVAHFPTSIYKAGEKYASTTVYRFGTV